MTRVVIVSARVGAGHDGAAQELARRFRARGMDVDRVDFLDLLPGPVGRSLCDLYRRQLVLAPRSWDWLLTALDTPLLAEVARRFARLAVARLEAVLGPDVALAVSTYPLATHALATAKARGALVAPLAVHLTDPSVHRLSVSAEADVTVAPTELAARQARALGARRVIVARPLVAPEFRPLTCRAERQRLRASSGLPVDRPLALVVSGSWGVGQVGQTAADVAASGRAVPVVVCGRNAALRVRLVAAGHPHVLGWVANMPELIRACDVVVQNAGGLTASEALASGVPVLTYRCLPGHGRTNAAALDADGTVPWIRSPSGLGPGLAAALADAARAQAMRDRARSVRERTASGVAG
jgi:UDP-N-acetylglucosamine:LPS N-acetylglucosamine transferase